MLNSSTKSNKPELKRTKADYNLKCQPTLEERLIILEEKIRDIQDTIEAIEEYLEEEAMSEEDQE